MKFISAVIAAVAALSVGTEAKPKTRVEKMRMLSERAKNGQFDKKTLLRNAKPHSDEAKRRGLGDIDITGSYSIQFDSCFSLTTSYEDVFDDDEEGMMTMNMYSNGNLMAIQSYAIFRLCWGSSCYANGNEALLEYVVDLNTYVSALVNYLPEQMEGFCEACQENEDNCNAILYGQYGQNYQGNNENAYKYQNYDAGDNNYNGANVNDVNYANGQYGYYANGQNQNANAYQNQNANAYQNQNANAYQNGGGRRTLKEFEQRVLENGQTVRQLDCQLCVEYSCFDDDDQGEYGFDAASEWLEEMAECHETGIQYQGGYQNAYGGNYYQNNNQDRNEAAELFAGIICNGDGTGIELAMFYDEECKLYMPNEPFMNYMSYFDSTYHQLTKEIVEFTFSNAVFSCKDQEIVYTTQDLSQYGGYYQGQDWNNNDDEAAEWCQTLVGGGNSEPVDMSSCGMYNYYQQDGNYQNWQGNQYYEEMYDQYQQQDESNQNMYQYDWYRYEITEDNALDMMEVCKLVKKSGGQLHTFYNTNNGALYSYASPNSASETITEFLEETDGEVDFFHAKFGKLSGGAIFAIVAGVGILLGAVVALFLRFKSTSVDDKNVSLMEDNVEPSGTVA